VGLAGPVHLRTDDRLIIVGPTGSGKSTLARALLRRVRHRVVVDSKAGPEWDGWGELVTRPEDPALRSADQVLFRLPPAADPDLWDALFWTLFRSRPHTLVYLDEAAHVTKAGWEPPGLRAIITQGRSRGIGLWASMQRPTEVSNFLISEAEHAIVFWLDLLPDVKKLTGKLGEGVKRAQGLARYEWLEWSRDTRVVRKHRPIDLEVTADANPETP